MSLDPVVVRSKSEDPWKCRPPAPEGKTIVRMDSRKVKVELLTSAGEEWEHSFYFDAVPELIRTVVDDGVAHVSMVTSSPDAPAPPEPPPGFSSGTPAQPIRLTMSKWLHQFNYVAGAGGAPVGLVPVS